jgi:hypothetical protein
MPRPPFINFPLDASLKSVIEECTRSSNPVDPLAEWSGNILSTKTVVYGSGRIAREGESVTHCVDPDELDQIKRLAHDAAKVMDGVPIRGGSKSPGRFREIFVAANVDEEKPSKIDPELIRARFGGTINPDAAITVEPLTESGAWWDEVAANCESASRLAPWKSMAQWFRTQPDFVTSAFVSIGAGNSDSPSPRLVLGLTRGGSLTGLFGCCPPA